MESELVSASILTRKESSGPVNVIPESSTQSNPGGDVSELASDPQNRALNSQNVDSSDKETTRIAFENTVLERRVAEMEHERRKLRDRMAEVERSVQAKKRRLAATRDDLEAFKRHEANLQRQLETLQYGAEGPKEEMAGLQLRSRLARTATAALREEAGELQHQLHGLQERRKKQETSLDRLKSLDDQNETRIRRAEQQVGELLAVIGDNRTKATHQQVLLF